ncbi:hypothetical protein PAXRUDRAFT_157665 [Paxillus rubicundulus Ve08.2h10]|uniref:Uncharacterized protein n=1 Tax=Paxillus rubicundulus Ve08.2h10 TaxID=930991 RepID=A0A0D0DHA6_9AGAM|nr:hypothetical protein PAXRUDRAFT_157665 [Paxillus rubicundulus Ve08.2h10]
MEELSMLLAQCDINFHPTHQQIMCFPHVMNICTQHILEAFFKTNLTMIATTFPMPSWMTQWTCKNIWRWFPGHKLHLGRTSFE